MFVIPPIVIDTMDISSKFSVSKEEIENMMDNIAKGLAAAYANKLESMAQNELHSTRRPYIQAIRLIDTGRFEGTVMLDYSKNPLVRMIEEGASAFDIKQGLMNSPKVKYTKDGRKYITVPFRLATPGAIGDSGVFSAVMPQEVYNLIKAKGVGFNANRGMVSDSLKYNELSPIGMAARGTRASIVDNKGNEQFKAYQHKNSIYEGVFKKQDAATGGNTYHSFRRVSESGINKAGQRIGSDPDAFIHPGIERHDLMQKALDQFNIQQELSLQLDNEFSKLGF